MTTMFKYTVAAILAVLALPAWGAPLPTVNLTNGPDQYTLKAPGGKVYALKGDDRIIGEGGTNTLFGGPGNDILIGRNYTAGRSQMSGGPGADHIYCDGNCSAHGNDGDDYIKAIGSITRRTIASLWGGLGRDTFDIDARENVQGNWVTINDMTPQDKVRIWLFDADTAHVLTLANFDLNHDGVIDVADAGQPVGSDPARAWFLQVNLSNPQEGWRGEMSFVSDAYPQTITITGVDTLFPNQIIQ